MKQFFQLTLAVVMVIFMVACSSTDNSPEGAAERHYLHYFDGSYPGPNDKYAKMATSEYQKKEFQRLLESEHERNKERYGAYKGYEVLDKKEDADGARVSLEIEFKHEKQNQTKNYTLYKTSEKDWVVR